MIFTFFLVLSPWYQCCYNAPVATAKTTVVPAGTAIAGIVFKSLLVLPHSEGAAVRVAPGAVAVGAVAGADAVAVGSGGSVVIA